MAVVVSGLVAALGWSISDIVALVAAVLAGIFVWRVGVDRVWRSNYEGMREQRDALKIANAKLESEAAHLRERPDLHELVEQLRVLHTQSMERHKREHDRWDMLTEQLQAVTQILVAQAKQRSD